MSISRLMIPHMNLMLYRCVNTRPGTHQRSMIACCAPTCVVGHDSKAHRQRPGRHPSRGRSSTAGQASAAHAVWMHVYTAVMYTLRWAGGGFQSPRRRAQCTSSEPSQGKTTRTCLSRAAGGGGDTGERDSQMLHAEEERESVPWHTRSATASRGAFPS